MARPPRRWRGVPRPSRRYAVTLGHPRRSRIGRASTRLQAGVRLRLVAGRQASNRGVSMRTLRGLLRAHWGKITCLLLGVGLVVGGVSYLMDQQRFAATAVH